MFAPPQLTGGGVLSTTRVEAAGSVHRYVPPTPVTSGSEAGHSTVGNGMSVPPVATGVLMMLAVPPSPDEPSTVTLFAAAETYAWRRLSSDWVLLNPSSAEAKLWLMTVARWWSTRYCSAFIMSGKPCTPRVSAVGTVTSRMFAPGANVWTLSTSSETSIDQAALFSWPVPLPGCCTVAGVPWMLIRLNVGMPAVQVTPSSPHMCGRPNAVSNTFRS